MASSSSAAENQAEKTIPVNDLTFSCGICLRVLYNPLTVVPCNHNYCASCLLFWRSYCIDAKCPLCATPILQLSKSHFVCEMVEAYAKANPEEADYDSRRREADLLELRLLEERIFNHGAWKNEDDCYFNFFYKQMHNRVETLRRLYPDRHGAVLVQIRQEEPARLQVAAPALGPVRVPPAARPLVHPARPAPQQRRTATRPAWRMGPYR